MRKAIAFVAVSCLVVLATATQASAAIDEGPKSVPTATNDSAGGGSGFVGTVQLSGGYVNAKFTGTLSDTAPDSHCAAVEGLLHVSDGSTRKIDQFNCEGSGHTTTVTGTASLDPAGSLRFMSMSLKACDGLYYSSTNHPLSSCGGWHRLLGYTPIAISSTHWAASRVDAGVDWRPRDSTDSVYAIGNGVITYSKQPGDPNVHWPYDLASQACYCKGGFIVYQLTNGPAKGKYVYVAEHIKDLLPVGTTVRAGQRIATALNGFAWTEWGWAATPGTCRLAASTDATDSPDGRAFARLLIGTGVTYPSQGSGPFLPPSVRSC